ncbi:DUF1499 domain-containing protein [Metabacillus mangrovi]|nr:DUF1499 domain-containing protein [Metabacillus mangrovi]
MNRIHACERNKKNCVSSFNSEPSQYVEPIPYHSDEKTAVQLMESVLLDLNGTEIEEKDPAYIRCICKTAFLKFKDDVEIWFDAENKKVHIKSSSRMGKYDFGVNKKRAKHVLKAFQEKEKAAR